MQGDFGARPHNLCIGTPSAHIGAHEHQEFLCVSASVVTFLCGLGLHVNALHIMTFTVHNAAFNASLAYSVGFLVRCNKELVGLVDHTVDALNFEVQIMCNSLHSLS